MKAKKFSGKSLKQFSKVSKAIINCFQKVFKSGKGFHSDLQQ